MQQKDITNEELQAELESMKASGRNSSPRKRINRKIKGTVSVKKLALILMGLSVLLVAFVWVSGLAGSIEADGYVIRIRDGYDLIGKNNRGDDEALDIGFDPEFSDAYDELVGLGYGDMQSLEGGSLFSSLGMDNTMFDQFQDFALSDEAASEYEGNKGQANFDQYYCNKYFLRNNGSKTIEYRLNIEISENLKNALDATRIMIVTGDESTGYTYQIFATANKETGEREVAAVKSQRTATSNYAYFIDPNLGREEYSSPNKEDAWLCENLVKDEETGYHHYYSCTRSKNGEILDGEMYKLEPGESICYTIAIWFEGSDEDHNNSIIGGGITFSINYETEQYLEALYILSQETKKNK